jgi:hypothetical protein
MAKVASSADVQAIRNDINRLEAQVERMAQSNAQLRTEMRDALIAFRTGKDVKSIGSDGLGEDITALAFIVLMEAAKSAREDLKAIMDGVRAINKQKQGWRQVANQINKLGAKVASKDDDKSVFDPDTGVSDEMGGDGMGEAKRKLVDLNHEQIAVNSPGADGEVIEGGFVIQGTGRQRDPPSNRVTKKDIDCASETVKSKLDSLSELGEMESLRLQMAMDRLSKLMSTLSNMLKKQSETAQAITQNIK